jgi:hypothetical protein
MTDKDDAFEAWWEREGINDDLWPGHKTIAKQAWDAHAALTKEQLEEWEQSFALYDKAIRSLTAYWHKHNPKAEPHTLPDTAHMCEWIVGELDRLNKEADLVKDVIEAERQRRMSTKPFDVGKNTWEVLVDREISWITEALDRLTEQDGKEQE